MRFKELKNSSKIGLSWLCAKSCAHQYQALEIYSYPQGLAGMTEKSAERLLWYNPMMGRAGFEFTKYSPSTSCQLGDY